MIAEADGTTGVVAKEYIWLPVDAVARAPISEGVNRIAQKRAGYAGTDLPVGVVDVAGTATPELLYVHADHLGRPIRLTDPAKVTAWAVEWLPWGGVHAISGSETLNARFPGQWFQVESGLHYNWHRHYDPTIGRYTQPDPLGFVDGPSVYAYAGNAPGQFVDPDGRLLRPSPSVPRLGPSPVPRPQSQPYTPPPRTNPGGTPTTDNQYYHLVCDQPAPPGLDKCGLAMWKLGRAKECLRLRKKWRDDYGPAPHDREIAAREQAVRNAEEQVKKDCEQEMACK